MVELLASLVVFTLTHALPSTPVRAWAINRVGRPAFMVAFSALSIGALAWVWLAYRAAPVETLLWQTDNLVRGASAALMLWVCLLMGFAITARRPVLLTGETQLADPSALEGAIRITRHPLLWAMIGWAVVHIGNNPDPASALVFGYVLGLSAIGTVIVDRRRARLLPDHWPRIAAATSNVPFVAILGGRAPVRLQEFSPLGLAFGVALWAGLLWAHPHVFGVAVFVGL